MENKANVYIKHQSFNNFYSSLNTDLQWQRQRVLDALRNYVDASHAEIIKAVIKDLSSGLPETEFRVTTHIADELSRMEDKNIPRYIIHRWRYDVNPNKKKLDAYPPYLQIEPTSVCNYRCVFCYQKDTAFTTKANGFMGSMSLELFKTVIDQAEGNVEFLSLASRGEPFLCKDIDHMLAYTKGKFLGLKVNTNASMLNEEHCHAVLSGGVNTLVFSADAATEPLYSQLRVKGNLEKVLANIRQFQSIRQKHYPFSKIITRVSGVKYGSDQEMDSMVNLWGDLVDQISFVMYNPWENVYESPVNDITTPCSDLWRRMFVWFDGSVNPCDTDFKSTLTVGKIQDMDLKQLWLSPAYQHLREEHLNMNRKSINPCRRCSVI
jgi:radical SAM protein with 4Fe4S-binding SPASM domain